MKRATKFMLSSLLLIPLAAPMSGLVMADQPAPPPGDQQQDPGGPPPPAGDTMDHPGGPQGRGGMRRPPGGDSRPGGRQGGMPGGGPGGAMAGDMNGFDRMRGYLDLVDRFSRLARDPAASGVAAVIAAGDILRPRGADATIDFFNKAMTTAKNDTVKRAIRLQLVDLYRQSGQNEKALEQLNQLIADAPPGSGPDLQTAPMPK